MLKFIATSRNPPIAPETIACNPIPKGDEKEDVYKNVCLHIQNIVMEITFKRGIVTVGGAAFAWNPIAIPFASSD